MCACFVPSNHKIRIKTIFNLIIERACARVKRMIESFKVVDEKIIKLAECTKVPRLMIIAGSNGSGKSTLLDTFIQLLNMLELILLHPKPMEPNPQILRVG